MVRRLGDEIDAGSAPLLGQRIEELAPVDGSAEDQLLTEVSALRSLAGEGILELLGRHEAGGEQRLPDLEWRPHGVRSTKGGSAGSDTRR